MKIVLITGMSGSGKTTIAQELCKDDKYNFIASYTDRPMREKNEWGHTFVDSAYMDLILEKDNIVAQSTIDKYRYCSITSQFDENKINVYIVDTFGINDTIKSFPQSDIMTILIRRNNIEADCIRATRDVHVPARDGVDFIIDNDYKVEFASGVINVLVNFNLFSHPSHVVETIQEKLDYIDKQYRHLDVVKESLYKQLWYINRPLYIELCKVVEKKINNDFDFDIKITPDDSPQIYDGYLSFHIIGEYEDEDVVWEDMNRMVELLSQYAHEYCRKNNYSDLEYRITVGERYAKEDDYL